LLLIDLKNNFLVFSFFIMIDSHCHLDFEDYDSDRDNIVKTAIDVGVFKIINPCSHYFSNFKVVELSNKYDGYYFSVGLHPEEVNKKNFGAPDDVDPVNEIEKIISNKKCVAIGEIGLDYHYINSDMGSCLNSINIEDVIKLQKKLFISQLELAKKYNKPVIIHNRESVDDIYSILKDYKLNGVIHCFSENLDWANKFIELGYYISFNGIITFKNCGNDLIEVVKNIPLERILIETDAPFLTPVPFRGKLNKPEYVRFVAEKIAELKNISVEEVIEITDNNCSELFGI